MWALSTCGEPDEIKKNTHPKTFTALFRDRVPVPVGSQSSGITVYATASQTTRVSSAMTSTAGTNTAETLSA